MKKELLNKRRAQAVKTRKAIEALYAEATKDIRQSRGRLLHGGLNRSLRNATMEIDLYLQTLDRREMTPLQALNASLKEAGF